MVVNDGKIEVLFEEPCKCNDVTWGLYYESLPESMLVYVKGKIFFKDHHLNKLNPCNRMDRKYEKIFN